jgi:hypothetical protein
MKTTPTRLLSIHCCGITAALLLIGLFETRGQGFYQNHRINALNLQGGTDSFATNNAFGGAFSSFGRQFAQNSIDTSVEDGSISILFSFPGLADLRGSNATSFAVGLANGFPVALPGNPASYSGTSDLDWWYFFNPNEVDGSGNALQQMPASITSSVLNSGPGQLSFPNPLAGGAMVLSSTYLRANIGAPSAPLTSTNHFPPGHRAGTTLEPGLMTFATMAQGQMRGNISAASLAATPIPAALASGGLTACSQNYNVGNSFLDLITGGCSVFIFGQVIFSTQPDQFDPNAPILGAGPPYTFTRTGNSVTGARDRLNGSVNLQAALNASAYSTYFTFTTDRVIAFTQPSGAPKLTNATVVNSSAFRFTFTNGPRATFTVFASTNVEAAFTNWSILGSPTQDAPGLFQFVDTNAPDHSRRFYQLRSP